MADSKTMKLQIISPDRIFYDGDVEMVETTTTEGDMGIYPEHIPLTAIVAPGVLTIHEPEGVKEAALHDGFIEIQKKKVVILAESCEWPEEIDVHRAEEAKIRAERRLKGTEGEISEYRAEAALRRSITRISLAEKYKR